MGAIRSVRPGNFVIIRAPQPAEAPVSDDWWLGQIIWCDDEVAHAGVGSTVKWPMLMTAACAG